MWKNKMETKLVNPVMVNSSTTDNTPVCDWMFESIEDINVHVVTGKYFIKIL